jgi:myosin V
MNRTKKNPIFYWVPHPEEIWIAAELKSESERNGLITVNLIKDTKISLQVKQSDCLLIENSTVMNEAVNDLISLSQVNDATILNSSRIRFYQKLIYTSIGAVLMAINPFETIPGLYGPQKINEYRNIRDENVVSHVYMIPARAYSAMCTFGQNQSLLISGESGAGKTEATKQCLDYLTRVSSSSSSSTGSGAAADQSVSQIASRIIAASPILEAFGNAQTIRNPNSSRFGKWMELIFSDENVILGSKIISYLLEVSHSISPLFLSSLPSPLSLSHISSEISCDTKRSKREKLSCLLSTLTKC